MSFRQVVIRSNPSRIGRVVSLLVGVLLLVLSAIAFTAFLAVAVVLGCIGGMRLWWTRRRTRAPAASHRGGVEAEYSVVRRRGTHTPQAVDGGRGS